MIKFLQKKIKDSVPIGKSFNNTKSFYANSWLLINKSSLSFRKVLLHYFLANRFTYFLATATLLVTIVSSCTVTKPNNYFKFIKKDTTIANVTMLPAAMKIKKMDVLSIVISSLSKEEDAFFNNAAARSASGAGFHVTNDGAIYMHKLGKVMVKGFTRNELKAYLEKELLPYLKEPVVTIGFVNHHVTVLGEIGKQQILPISDESISIIDVLAQSGNINPVTKLSDVMIIREKDQSKEFHHINLEDHSIFTSPYYYLQPNDVVVLNQDEKIVRQQLNREKYQQYSGVIFQTLSVAIIIYQSFFRK